MFSLVSIFRPLLPAYSRLSSWLMIHQMKSQPRWVPNPHSIRRVPLTIHKSTDVSKTSDPKKKKKAAKKTSKRPLDEDENDASDHAPKKSKSNPDDEDKGDDVPKPKPKPRAKVSLSFIPIFSSSHCISSQEGPHNSSQHCHSTLFHLFIALPLIYSFPADSPCIRLFIRKYSGSIHSTESFTNYPTSSHLTTKPHFMPPLTWKDLFQTRNATLTCIFNCIPPMLSHSLPTLSETLPKNLVHNPRLRFHFASLSTIQANWTWT